MPQAVPGVVIALSLVFFRVMLPLLAAGLLAGLCLVFLTAVTELTATLVLAPIGVKTLATQFWAFQSEVAYGAAAPYALVIGPLLSSRGRCSDSGLTGVGKNLPARGLHHDHS